MASTFVKSNRMMKRTESKKSHSWWWDSHISPKNSKWLQENLEEMDQYVKRMLKLIEEDADSFAKKAEMYYQKRPELINLVEEFYRMYRSLAERYDHVTGELRKNIPSDLQSQCSGISDIGSEPPSTMPSPERRPSRRKSGRAAGFDFFLGGGTELYNKEGDESSTLDSESESDDSSVHNYSGVQNDEEEQGLRQKIIELEVELRQVKEKLQVQEEPINESYFKKGGDENCEAHDKVIAKYEEELQVTKEKLRVSEEEISRLTVELQTYESLVESSASMEQNRVRELQESFDGPELVHKIQSLEEELSIMQEKLRESEEEVMSLRQEITIKESTIENLQDELSAWRNNLGRETGEVAKLQDHVERYKMNLLEREQEIQELKEAMSNSHKSLSEENKQLKAEISQLSKERTYLDDNLKELDLSRQSLEEDLRLAKAREAETEELKTALSALQQKYNILTAEKDDLNANISALSAEVNSKDDQIDQMSHHLQQLHMEHVNLIAAAEVARKSAVELRLRIKELEREVEKKQQIIVEGAEEKREAIRQLCFSLEHYRNGYHRLREVVVGNKGTPVMAT